MKSENIYNVMIKAYNSHHEEIQVNYCPNWYGVSRSFFKSFAVGLACGLGQHYKRVFVEVLDLNTGTKLDFCEFSR